MAENVITQNAQGDTVVHKNVSGVELLTESGGTATFVHDAEIRYENLPDKPDLKNVATTGSYNDLQDRPCGDAQDVVPETEAEFVEDDGIICWSSKTEVGLVVGESYIVTWGDKEFTCTAKHASDIVEGLVGGVFLGNAILFLNAGYGEDTGEPFIFTYNPDMLPGDNNCGFWTNETDATRTVRVRPTVETIKLDAKYLPDGIATKDFVEQKIAEIDTSGGSSGSGLPKVTEADDGKFLGVTGGKWAAVSAPTGGSSGGASSWNDLTDRPFEDTRSDVLQEGDANFGYIETYGAFGCGLAFGAEAPAFQLAAGDECTVVWDGVEYKVTVIDTSAVMPNTLAVGNGSNFGLPGNEEPFVIAWDNSGVTFLSTVDTSETKHTIRIYQGALKTLDSKYIPDPPYFDLVAMGLPTVSLDGIGVSVECDATEIRAAAAKGLMKVKIAVNVPGVGALDFEHLLSAAYLAATDAYTNSAVFAFDTSAFVIVMTFTANGIHATALPLATATT